MKLYNADLSPNALRVRAVANELGIELELVDVNLRDAKEKVETLLPWNPNTKVPVLVDGDFVLWESRAIIAYLASLRPEAGLYPADPKRRGIIDQWSYWGAIHLGPALQRVSFERFIKAKLRHGRAGRGGDRRPAEGGGAVPAGARRRARRQGLARGRAQPRRLRRSRRR